MGQRTGGGDQNHVHRDQHWHVDFDHALPNYTRGPCEEKVRTRAPERHLEQPHVGSQIRTRRQRGGRWRFDQADRRGARP